MRSDPGGSTVNGTLAGRDRCIEASTCELHFNPVLDFVRKCHDRSVGNEYVESALLLEKLLSCRLGRLKVRQIEGEEEDRALGGWDFGGESCDRILCSSFAAAGDVDLGCDRSVPGILSWQEV